VTEQKQILLIDM